MGEVVPFPDPTPRDPLMLDVLDRMEHGITDFERGSGELTLIIELREDFAVYGLVKILKDRLKFDHDRIDDAVEEFMARRFDFDGEPQSAA